MGFWGQEPQKRIITVYSLKNWQNHVSNNWEGCRLQLNWLKLAVDNPIPWHYVCWLSFCNGIVSSLEYQSGNDSCSRIVSSGVSAVFVASGCAQKTMDGTADGGVSGTLLADRWRGFEVSLTNDVGKHAADCRHMMQFLIHQGQGTKIPCSLTLMNACHGHTCNDAQCRHEKMAGKSNAWMTVDNYKLNRSESPPMKIHHANIELYRISFRRSSMSHGSTRFNHSNHVPFFLYPKQIQTVVVWRSLLQELSTPEGRRRWAGHGVPAVPVVPEMPWERPFEEYVARWVWESMGKMSRFVMFVKRALMISRRPWFCSTQIPGLMWYDYLCYSTLPWNKQDNRGRPTGRVLTCAVGWLDMKVLAFQKPWAITITRAEYAQLLANNFKTAKKLSKGFG